MRALLKLNKYTKALILAILWLCFYFSIITLDRKYNFLPWGDIKLYERIAANFVNGKIPFVDYYFEYPPASIITFALPKLLSNNVETYRAIYQFLNLTFAFATLYIGAETMYLVMPAREKGIGIIQTILFFILIQLVLTRYDVFPMFLTALGLFLYLYGEKNKKRFFQTLSYAVITLAGLVKLYPFLLLPIFAIKEFKLKEYKALIINIIACATVSLPFVFLLIAGIDGVKWFLAYHGERGLEIESTYSSLLLFLSQVGLLKDIEIIYSHASYGLSGSLASIFSKLSFPLFGLIYGGTLVLLYKQNWKKDVCKKIITASLLVTLLFVLTNKVFSAQYILWFFPLLVLFAFTQKIKLKKILLVLITIIIISTILIYPIFWGIFNKGHLLLTALLLLRNTLLIIVMAIAFFQVISRKHKKTLP